MLNSGEKKLHFARQNKTNILTLVLSGKKILNKTKNHNPPCKLNGRSLKMVLPCEQAKCLLKIFIFST